jgi:uncharacterized protein YjaZ
MRLILNKKKSFIIIYIIFYLVNFSFYTKLQAITMREMNTVSKKQYLIQFTSIMQKEFCDGESAFHKCINLTEVTCKSEVKESLSSCLDKVRMPSTINIALSNPQLGQNLGECTGAAFYRRNQKKKVDLPICKRRSTWQ